MSQCDNCGANVPTLALIGDRRICCPHCFFNPFGCRCWCGENGVAETMDYGPWDDDDDDEMPLFMEAGR